MEFRLAKEEDIDIVYDYIRKLAVFESREDDFKLDKETLYKAMFEDNLGEVMLATEDGKIIGYCFFYHVFSSFSGLKASSVSGRITASLPEEPGFTVKYKTVSGKRNLASFLSPLDDGYVCGDGSGAVSLETVSGDIRLTGKE